MPIKHSEDISLQKLEHRRHPTYFEPQRLKQVLLPAPHSFTGDFLMADLFDYRFHEQGEHVFILGSQEHAHDACDMQLWELKGGRWLLLTFVEIGQSVEVTVHYWYC